MKPGTYPYSIIKWTGWLILSDEMIKLIREGEKCRNGFPLK